MDAGKLDLDDQSVQNVLDIDYLRVKKRLIIRHCIKKYCKEDCIFVYLFSDGLISEIALDLQKEVICLVESLEDQRKLSTKLLTFAKSNNCIRQWENLSDEDYKKRIKLCNPLISGFFKPRTKYELSFFIYFPN